MKRFAIQILITLVISSLGLAQTLIIHTTDGTKTGYRLSEIDSITYSIFDSPPFPLDGLIAYYPFEGSADDEGQNGLHGIVNGASLIEDRHGSTNSAYSFDGIDDYIYLGSSSLFSTPNITVAAWFQSTSQEVGYPHSQVIVRNRYYGYNLVMNKSLSDGTQNIGGVSGSVRISHSEITCNYNSPPDLYNDGEWHFAALTYDGELFSFYIDGRLVYEQIANPALPIYYETGGVAIGRDGNNPNNYFHGNIDDVYIYNRALTSEEISRIFQY